MIWLYALLLCLGLFFLAKGGDLFVEGATGVARKYGISEHVIGATLVAFSTSLPEFAVSCLASVHESGEIAVGTIVGSNISNIALILGISALLMTLTAPKEATRDGVMMIFITAAFLILSLDGKIQLADSILLLLLFGFFVRSMIRRGRIQREDVEDGRIYMMLVIGVAGVIGGGEVTVRATVELCTALKIPTILMALTVIAVGTSLPELATSVAAALKKKYGIAVGNIIGSNVFNLAFIGGVAGIISPLPVDHVTTYTLLPFLIGISAVTTVFLRRMGKGVGIFLLLTYGIFIYFLHPYFMR